MDPIENALGDYALGVETNAFIMSRKPEGRDSAQGEAGGPSHGPRAIWT